MISLEELLNNLFAILFQVHTARDAFIICGKAIHTEYAAGWAT